MRGYSISVLLGMSLLTTSAIGQNTFPSSGNVGIGTTSIEHRLEVVSNQGVGTTEWSPHGVVVVSANPITDPYSTMIWMDTDKSNNIGYIQAYQRGIGARPLVLQAGPGGSGNVGIGTISPSAKLEVNGNITLTSGSGASMIFSDGTVQSTAWSGTLSGGDYAEAVDITGERSQYEPGDVLVVDPDHPGHFLKATERYSTLVAGIYSTKPGMIGRRQTIDRKLASAEIPMAMVGVVPTKVTAENGPIHPGDILVTSSTAGRAMKGTDRSLFAGAILGKALGSLDSGAGVIEVLVSLHRGSQVHINVDPVVGCDVQ
jgi:hypothetical protein